MANQTEQVAANIWALPSAPSTPSSQYSGSYVSGTPANPGSRRSTPGTRSTSHTSTPGPSNGVYVPETPFDEYGRPIYRQGGFRQPGFSGVEYDDILRNQRGF